MQLLSGERSCASKRRRRRRILVTAGDRREPADKWAQKTRPRNRLCRLPEQEGGEQKNTLIVTCVRPLWGRIFSQKDYYPQVSFASLTPPAVTNIRRLRRRSLTKAYSSFSCYVKRQSLRRRLLTKAYSSFSCYVKRQSRLRRRLLAKCHSPPFCHWQAAKQNGATHICGT